MFIRKEIKQIVTDGIVCDVCGKTMSVHTGAYGLLYADFGYDSDFDGECWQSHFCDSCFMLMVEYIRSLGGVVRDGNDRTIDGDHAPDSL